MPDYGDDRGFRDVSGRFPQRTIMDEATKYSNELPGSGGWTPNRGDFARRFRNPDTTTVPEGFNAPDRFGRMRPTQANNPYAGRINNNPMGGANIGGGWNQYEGGPGPRHYFPVHYAATMGGGGGGNPFDPGNLGMDSGGPQGIFGGSKAYAANDIVDAIMGGMDRAQEPGTDITRYTDDYKVIKRKLWPKAVNKFPPGTPKPVIVQEWERLQEEYWRLKDQQGYRPGVT